MCWNTLARVPVRQAARAASFIRKDRCQPDTSMASYDIDKWSPTCHSTSALACKTCAFLSMVILASTPAWWPCRSPGHGPGDSLLAAVVMGASLREATQLQLRARSSQYGGQVMAPKMDSMYQRAQAWRGHSKRPILRHTATPPTESSNSLWPLLSAFQTKTCNSSILFPLMSVVLPAFLVLKIKFVY